MTCDHSTDHQLAADTSYSQGVVEVMARAHGIDPIDLPPLNHAIDPEALDAMLTSLAHNPASDGGSVVFAYHDHTVTVDASGHVHLAPE